MLTYIDLIKKLRYCYVWGSVLMVDIIHLNCNVLTFWKLKVKFNMETAGRFWKESDGKRRKIMESGGKSWKVMEVSIKELPF